LAAVGHHRVGSTSKDEKYEKNKVPSGGVPGLHTQKRTRRSTLEKGKKKKREKREKKKKEKKEE